MSELNIMDYFLSKSNDKVEFKTEPDLDISSNYDNSELMSSDFFDSILSLEKPNLDGCELDSGLFDNLDVDVSIASDGSIGYDDMQCETSTFSDSGLSSDLQEISDQVLSDDELLKSILDTPTSSGMQEEQKPMVPVQSKPTEYVRPIIASVMQPAEPEKPKIINIIKPIQKAKQVIKVQPLNGNSRSVLLPINIKDLKTIKIINTNNLKAENIKFTTSSMRQTKKINTTEKFIMKPSRKCVIEEEVSGDSGVRRHRQQPSSPAALSEEGTEAEEDGSDCQYPLLLLTAEEKRLLSKDGIQLPCRYPLTKHEERELKRIRRKIRNKISAQDSRKRKKEYVDGLEERVKQCSEENRSLLKRIKLLQLQNSKLSSQLSKLQALVFKTGTSRAHPATCLMIVLLSVMLVTLPNLRNNGGAGGAGDKELNTLQQYVARRALLFSQQATNEDTASLNMDEFITFPSMKSSEAVDGAQDVVDVVNGSTRSDKSSYDSMPRKLSIDGLNPPGVVDYGGGGEHLQHGMKRYIEPDIDDYWPPVKKRNVSMSTSTSTLTSTSAGLASPVNQTKYFE